MLAIPIFISEVDSSGVQLERLGKHGLILQASETYPRTSVVDIESHAGGRGNAGVGVGMFHCRWGFQAGAADPPRLYAGRGK